MYFNPNLEVVRWGRFFVVSHSAEVGCQAWQVRNERERRKYGLMPLFCVETETDFALIQMVPQVLGDDEAEVEAAVLVAVEVGREPDGHGEFRCRCHTEVSHLSGNGQVEKKNPLIAQRVIFVLVEAAGIEPASVSPRQEDLHT